MFAIVFLRELNRAISAQRCPDTKSRVTSIRIFDQNGQPAVSGVPSPTGAIVPVTVGGGNGFQFVPDTRQHLGG